MNTVDHPAHYSGADNPYEVIQVLEHWLTPEEHIGFLRGNVIKYTARARMKGELEDLQKASWYSRRLVTFIERQKSAVHGEIVKHLQRDDPTGAQHIAQRHGLFVMYFGELFEFDERLFQRVGGRWVEEMRDPADASPLAEEDAFHPHPSSDESRFA